jgi:hypothetical protein
VGVCSAGTGCCAAAAAAAAALVLGRLGAVFSEGFFLDLLGTGFEDATGTGCAGC